MEIHLNFMLFIFVFYFVPSKATDDVQYIYRLFHSFHQGGESPDYKSRGYISWNPSKNSDATYVQEKPMPPEEISALRKLVEKGGMYHLKIVSNYDNIDKGVPIYTLTKACSVFESGLNDYISLAMDQNFNLISGGISAHPSSCDGEPVPDSKLKTFNTSVNIVTITAAPVPDTLTYIQRLEQEKAEKARGEQGDNRSFFGKYWMYIVPLVIFLFISGASGPEGQGGGR